MITFHNIIEHINILVIHNCFPISYKGVDQARSKVCVAVSGIKKLTWFVTISLIEYMNILVIYNCFPIS